MDYSLRSANDSDKAWLEDLRRASYANLSRATWGRWDEDRHQRHFAESWHQGQIELVEIDGHPIGMIQLIESANHIEVSEIQIVPEHQCTGVGTQLLADVIDRARQRNKDVVLSTGLMNTRAARFFARLGFEETGRTDTHIHFMYNTCDGRQ